MIDIIQENKRKNNISMNEKSIEEIAQSIKTINGELGDIRDEAKETNKKIDKINLKIIKVETDTCWIKKFLWLIITASITGLIIGIINLLMDKA